MIRLKDKDNSLFRIEEVVRSQVSASMSNLHYMPLQSALEQAITAAVMAGIEELIRQQYSDEDFERDIKLNT